MTRSVLASGASRGPSDSVGWIPGLVGAVAVLVSGLYAGRQSLGFPLDDAWIHLVYARSIAAFEPFCYNPGEPSTGFTSPLWVLLLAPVELLLGRASPALVVAAVQGVGLVAHVATAVAAAQVLHVATDRRGPALVAGILVAVNPALVAAALSGMEVSPAGLAVVVAVVAALQGRAWRCGVALALAIGLRPEAAVVLVVVAGWWAVNRRDALPRVLLPPVLALLALCTLYLALSGRPLPATFYFKQQAALHGLPARIWTVATVLLPAAGAFWSTGGVPLLALGVTPGRPANLLPGLVGVVWVVASAWMVAPIDPGAFYHARYVLPAVPVLLCGVVLGAWRAAELVGPRHRRGVWVGLAIGAGLVSLSALPRVTTRHANDARNIDEVQRRIGEYLKRETPADAWIAATDAGAIRYFSDRPVVDLMGLNTPGLYWQAPEWGAEHPVTYVAVLPAWEVPVNAEALAVLHRFETDNYTVTFDPRMAVQVVAACAQDVDVRFRGVRDVTVRCSAASR